MVLQSKQRLLELNAKLADTLTNKGVMATADETTTSLINKVSDISSSGDDGVLVSLIDRSIESVVIPNTVTNIGTYAFAFCPSLTSVTISNSVTSIDDNAFTFCRELVSITIPNSVTSIGRSAFYFCTSLTSVTIPNSVTSIGSSIFDYCNKIKNVTLGDGFNANNLNLSSSTLIERETMINMFNSLADRTGLTAYTLTLGSTNLAKLSEEDILIATNKNWTLA